jgi:hypothetical protein
MDLRQNYELRIANNRSLGLINKIDIFSVAFCGDEALFQKTLSLAICNLSLNQQIKEKIYEIHAL